MKTISRHVALILGILTTAFTNAQDADMKNMLKFGGNAGVAVPSSNASANAGIDLAYQHLVVPGFGLGVATGYNHFFGKENDGLENNDFGVVPVAALLRVYPQEKGFYFGTDVGYGFITGNEKVASNSTVDRPDGGLYLKPEIGWHNRHWNVALQYNKVFTGDKGTIGSQKYNVSSIGLGVSYNLPLGE